MFAAKSKALTERFGYVEGRLSEGPYFAGPKFSLVDAAFAPVFRYFDVFDMIADFGILESKPKTARWRQAMHARPSVHAVGPDYATRLRTFLLARKSCLSHFVQKVA